ncbi:MAG: hypothetical protein MK184_01240 [Acidimicrobiales bacterium]|nr:hypothetical protein [Acidimicrobiales bacterium]
MSQDKTTVQPPDPELDDDELKGDFVDGDDAGDAGDATDGDAETDDEDDEDESGPRPEPSPHDDDDDEPDPDDVEADLDKILRDRIAADDDDDDDDDDGARPASVPPGGVEARQETELHCPHCFLLVQRTAVAETGECGHCGGSIS